MIDMSKTLREVFNGPPTLRAPTGYTINKEVPVKYELMYDPDTGRPNRVQAIVESPLFTHRGYGKSGKEAHDGLAAFVMDNATFGPHLFTKLDEEREPTAEKTTVVYIVVFGPYGRLEEVFQRRDSAEDHAAKMRILHPGTSWSVLEMDVIP